MVCSVSRRFEAAWKDPECDRIYEHLRREMEIDRRYEALEDKVCCKQLSCMQPVCVKEILIQRRKCNEQDVRKPLRRMY